MYFLHLELLKRENVDLKNQADGLCFEATKLMNENKEQLGEEACQKLKDAIDRANSLANPREEACNELHKILLLPENRKKSKLKK